MAATDNNLRVPDELRETAAKLAKRQGRSADDLAAEVLEALLRAITYLPYQNVLG